MVYLKNSDIGLGNREHFCIDSKFLIKLGFKKNRIDYLLQKYNGIKISNMNMIFIRKKVLIN